MEAFIWVYVVTTLASLAIAYVLVRFGVKHGTRSALREHELWMRDGSLDPALDRHAKRMLERAQLAELDRRASGLG